VLSQLIVAEKNKLISGTDFWHLSGVQRLGIPAIRTSDGPNGVRGIRFFNGVPAACLPCGTALGATWDVELSQQGGALMGREAIAKGVSVLLGPTINMQRSPLGGRGFESFSEDPVLAGNMAAASVKGIQSTGVAATIKHFVCNDLEDKRMASNSIVSERALREVYLRPFQIVQRDAKPMAFMTSYNLLNGVHCSEDPRLLKEILREEWGFDGLVMSDWFGTYSTAESMKAGMDLEMPGPSLMRGAQLRVAMRCGKILIHDLDERAREVLKLIKRVLPLQIPEGAPEKTIDSPETASFLRKLTSNSLVLLKNEGSVLPFKKDRTTAVIGPNAAFAAYCGGGSASLLPYYAISPLDGIRAQCPQAQYKLGVAGHKLLPLLSRLTKMADGNSGLDVKFYHEPPSVSERAAFDELKVRNSYMTLFDYKHAELKGTLLYADIDGEITPDISAEYDFSCSVAGTAKIFVDGECVVDNMTKQYPGDSFFGAGTREEIGTVHLEAGKTYKVHVDFGSLPTTTFHKDGVTAFGPGGLRLGCHRKVERTSEIAEAVELAKSVDQVVLCVGLNSDWESEGHDRKDMHLPPGNNELVEAIISANPNTAVVLQSGTPVTMPWADRAPALIQAWYGGNETGNGIADVIFGDVNPSGKLSLSFPRRNEDNPAFLNYNSDGNRVVYGEDVYIGYRHYERIGTAPLFPFGFGLSYTTFSLSGLRVSADQAADSLFVSLTVENSGAAAGAEVVQVYVAARQPSLGRPHKELKGFQKVFLQPQESRNIDVSISLKYATSYYAELRKTWACEKGAYTVLVGNSSDSTPLEADFELERDLYWTGL